MRLMTATQRRRRRQRGMTLMEVLVAVLIFTVVFLAALALYETANRAYLRTDSATIQQQNVRFAMDRMSETIRQAGANYNATGSLSIPDEQVEGAWETAIFVRGDFDNSRETALENGTHPIVTVGNDEIVGYVLRKPGGDAANPATITIKADLTPSSGRDGSISGSTITNEETVTVRVAATTLNGETNPPYELDRVTFDSAGNPQYEVLADNIFRLSFTYLNAAGANAITTYGSGDAERGQRAAVRQLAVNLTGMATRPDPGYIDPNTYTPAEANWSKSYRKFALSEHLAPPSLGIMGHRIGPIPSISIPAPASLTVCVGHCEMFHVTWASVSGMTAYKVRITAPASGPDQAFDDTYNISGTSYDFHQPTSTSRAYTFQVAATTGTYDGTFTGSVTQTSSNDTTQSIPSAPTNVSGTASGQNMVLNWNPVTTNTGTLSSGCSTWGGGSTTPPSPWNTAASDLAKYEVYRVRAASGVTGGFAPASTNRIDTVSPNTTPTVALDAGIASNAFTDKMAAPCSPYYYRVKAVDYCALAGSPSAPMATSVATGDPGTDPPVPNPLSGSITTGAGTISVSLTWPPRTAPPAIAHYLVERWRMLSSEAAYSQQGTIDVYEANGIGHSGEPAADVVPTTVGGQSAKYRYYVRSVWDCSPARQSVLSNPFDACSVPAANTFSVNVPAAGADISRPYETGFAPKVTLVGGSWTNARVSIPNTSYSDSRTPAGGTGVVTFSTFDATNLPDGSYTLVALATVNSCDAPAIVVPFTLSTGTCGLSITNPSWTSTNGAGAYTSLQFQVSNNCDLSDLTFNSLKFAWSGVPSGAFVTTIKYNGTTFRSGLTAATGAQNSAISFGSGNIVTVTKATTSNTFTITFNDNMTDDGTKDGTPGTFSSIIAGVTAPAASDDELIGATSVP